MLPVSFQPYVIFKVKSQAFSTTFAGTVATTLSVPDGTNRVLIQVETSDVRCTWDGTTTPTTTLGFLLAKAAAGYPGVYQFNYDAAVALKMVASAATSSINVSYEQGQ